LESIVPVIEDYSLVVRVPRLIDIDCGDKKLSIVDLGLLDDLGKKHLASLVGRSILYPVIG
jgi:hypothetical protein